MTMLAVISMMVASQLVAQQAPLNAADYPPGSLIGDSAIASPELSARGAYRVGVRTVVLTNPGQIDVVRSVKDQPAAMYDRRMTVEIWYPAVPGPEAELTLYTEHLGRSDQAGTLIPFTFVGRAIRDAAPDKKTGPYPLVIISHGYPGSRYMLSYLGENLASKGYVVVAIGHTDSTYEDISAFASTLLNRELDQRFVISEMLSLSAGSGVFSSLCDKDNVGLIGYSMGGYGALHSLGAGANERIKAYAGDFAAQLLASPQDSGDERIKAAVLFAPWGGAAGGPPTGLWDQGSLARIKTPSLWIAGSKDDIAGYAGIVSLFESTKNSMRYLLTYENALHNVAPNQAPPQALTWGQASRWADPVWDSRRIMGINEHFITAFLAMYLKGDSDAGKFFDVKTESSGDGVFALNKDGTKAATHTYWPGFQARTALGMRLRSLRAGE